MKTRIVMIVVLLSFCAGMAILPMGCGKGSRQHEAARSASYHCPMHPAVVSDKPGDCPICGMRLVPIEASQKDAATASSSAVADRKTLYRSTMNPTEVREKPGKDSMGMEMEAFEIMPAGNAAVPGLAAVPIAPEARQRMGLTLGTVEKRMLSRHLRTSAHIAADETRLFRVTTKVEGWVEKLFVSVTGQEVHKGDPLLVIYSPQLVSAQQEYLTVIPSAGPWISNTADDAAIASKALIASARQRLQLWDISDEQIARLEKTRQVEKTLTLYAPSSGYVTEKNVLAGQKIMPGDPLMVVADLSVVWGDADLYESDLSYVKVGMPMEITLPYWPDKAFQGKVSFISPSLNPESRTLSIRLEIPNPEVLLKLGMYADARLTFPVGERIAIPETAVMRTGERIYTFRDAGDGKLVPVEIKLGVRSDGFYEVLAGLNAGDRVVTSANFLVDSESSMKAALEALVGK
ncbi:MAG: efflux RND transporter periplasmic adaptor subunit [Kiritimatiellae bacterium]|nr:efflux RND transporter periplasmic adaptor subunit [Kiritimatiellia bacterium]